MAFFDDIQNTLMKAGDAAAQKTKEITETAKLKGQISSEQQVIQDSYARIGQIYYSRFASNPEPDLAALCQRITEAILKIQDCENQIREMKNEAECPVCHARLPKGTAFCSQCGARMEVRQNPASENGQKAPAVIYCRSCGAQNAAGTRFCSECGTKLDN